MEPILSQWVEPLFVNNGPVVKFPPGVVGWEDMGVLVIWFVLLAFFGCLLALMNQGGAGHPHRKVRRHRSTARRRYVRTTPADARLAYAHSEHARRR